MPCHDSPTIDKASPMTFCTSESAIMARDGQRRGGEAQDKRTHGRDATAGRGRDGGTANGTANAATHPTRLPPTSLLGAAVRWGKYPVSKFFYKM